jgi:uncharacterized small protein (DUF1192 family)
MGFLEMIGGTGIILIALAGTVGWVVTTWLKVRHGYPLEGSWGQTLKPVHSNETTERIKLLTSENAQLAAELSAMKERLVTLERIATDSGSRLANEIERLKH